MSSQPLWLSVEPNTPYTRLLLSQPGAGTSLKARLPSVPSQPGGVAQLMEALANWYGRPLCAVVDADAEDVQLRPELWARLLGEAEGPRVHVEWVSTQAPLRRDRFFDAMGDFATAKKLLLRGATGQK
jgi:hypothetical protein